MPQFIHITDERQLKHIERSGIRAAHWRGHGRCVYATPVLKDFLVSHQWLRELKRRGIKTMGAVQFEIPDTEPVLVGPYNLPHMKVTAAQAVKIFMEHSTGLGLETLIARRIEPKEIRRTYVPPQVVGWRYTPDAHGKPPFCYCDYCQKGSINSRKLRDRYKARLRLETSEKSA